MFVYDNKVIMLNLTYIDSLVIYSTVHIFNNRHIQIARVITILTKIKLKYINVV